VYLSIVVEAVQFLFSSKADSTIYYMSLIELVDNSRTDLRKYIKTYDLRTVKNRHDDILFVIDKTQL
jgi:hypothetical protein